jgi:prophage maintenance system killer protein
LASGAPAGVLRSARLSPRALRRPSLALAVAVNRAVRAQDEWFEEPDDLDRVRRALSTIDTLDDPVDAAAVLAYGVTRTQGFTEGNKRTALLLARWVLDRNGEDGSRFLPLDDREFASLLIQAAAGADVQDAFLALLRNRR